MAIAGLEIGTLNKKNDFVHPCHKFLARHRQVVDLTIY